MDPLNPGIPLLHPRILQRIRLRQPGIDRLEPLIRPLVIITDPSQLYGEPLITGRDIRQEIGQQMKTACYPRKASPKPAGTGWRSLPKTPGFTV
jgi:hypothetical protein